MSSSQKIQIIGTVVDEHPLMRNDFALHFIMKMFGVRVETIRTGEEIDFV